jgi:class 3 adenylate cyclase
MERRLAAILVADVVGYSRLMEQDEAGTLVALRDRRKSILAPLVALHKGRIVRGELDKGRESIEELTKAAVERVTSTVVERVASKVLVSAQITADVILAELEAA